MVTSDLRWPLLSSTSSTRAGREFLQFVTRAKVILTIAHTSLQCSCRRKSLGGDQRTGRCDARLRLPVGSPTADPALAEDARHHPSSRKRLGEEHHSRQGYRRVPGPVSYHGESRGATQEGCRLLRVSALPSSLPSCVARLTPTPNPFPAEPLPSLQAAPSRSTAPRPTPTSRTTFPSGTSTSES